MDADESFIETQKTLVDYSQVPKDLNSLPGCRGYQAGQDGINHWVIDYKLFILCASVSLW
jgi:hypothetical protein